jgi:transcriptional regulator with XRE-family HTH domain
MKTSSINYVLKRYRRSGGFKQKDTARLLHASSTLVSRLETGKRAPSLRVAIAYEVLTGMPISKLFSAVYESYEEETIARVTSMLATISNHTSEPAKAKIKSLERCQERAIIKLKQHMHAGETSL